MLEYNRTITRININFLINIGPGAGAGRKRRGKKGNLPNTFDDDCSFSTLDGIRSQPVDLEVLRFSNDSIVSSTVISVKKKRSLLGWLCLILITLWCNVKSSSEKDKLSLPPISSATVEK